MHDWVVSKAALVHLAPVRWVCASCMRTPLVFLSVFFDFAKAKAEAAEHCYSEFVIIEGTCCAVMTALGHTKVQRAINLTSKLLQ